MRDLGVADWIVVGEFGLALAALVTFVVGYTLSSGGAWARSPEGRHLVIFRSGLAAFMAMAVAHNLVTDYPGRDAVRICIVGWFAIGAVQGVVLLYRAQRRRLRAEPPAAAKTLDTSGPRR